MHRPHTHRTRHGKLAVMRLMRPKLPLKAQESERGNNPCVTAMLDSGCQKGRTPWNENRVFWASWWPRGPGESWEKRSGGGVRRPTIPTSSLASHVSDRTGPVNTIYRTFNNQTTNLRGGRSLCSVWVRSSKKRLKSDIDLC